MKRIPITSAVFVFCLAGQASGQINREIPMATPTIDGSISAFEMATQLAVPMEWPMEEGALLLSGSGDSPEELSATWYVSWDDQNLNLSAVVLDNTPDFRVDSNGGNSPYNAQDVIQPVFNPRDDHTSTFVDPIAVDAEPGLATAAIYDIVVNTADDFGPDVYRHGPTLEEEQHESIALAGQQTETGYILEMALPWAVAMDDYEPDYEPTLEDQHGLGFILLSFNQEQGATGDIATLYTDFGNGANTIGDPTTWNVITLAGPLEPPCNPGSGGDLDGNGEVEFADFLTLSANFGNEVADHTLGDVDCNGMVEFADFLILSANFGGGGAGTESIPEPTGRLMMGLAGLATSLWIRRRRPRDR